MRSVLEGRLHIIQETSFVHFSKHACQPRILNNDCDFTFCASQMFLQSFEFDTMEQMMALTFLTPATPLLILYGISFRTKEKYLLWRKIKTK